MIFVLAIRPYKLLVLRNTLHTVSNETLLLRLPSIFSCLALNFGLPNERLTICLSTLVRHLRFSLNLKTLSEIEINIWMG